MPNDDFDTEIQCEEAYTEDFSNICCNCGTNHSDPAIETACYIEQEKEMKEFIKNEWKGMYSN